MEPRKSEQTGQGTQQRPPEQQERPVRREQGEPIGQTMRVIDAIDRLLADAYRVPLSKSKCVVDASEMEDLLGQLRMALPRAVTQAQSILADRDRLINEAKKNADEIADKAEAEADAYDKTTRQKAQETAQAILADAQTRAEQIIFGAQQQAQKMLDENEITRRAQAYAMETRERAEKDADSIYNQACVHADKLLCGAAAALSRSAGELTDLRDSLLGPGQPQNR